MVSVAQIAGVALLATCSVADAAGTESFNTAPCDKAIIGHASADWRRESVTAGPVGVRRDPLGAMSRAGSGEFVTKMPLLVEGQTPLAVSVPPGLRGRVFLYYGRILDRSGKPTTSFNQARGYEETEFQPCDDRPRTIWPGGVRIKGTGAVHLTVTVPGRAPMILRLGRPRVYEPTR
jgi:hypothetical protein